MREGGGDEDEDEDEDLPPDSIEPLHRLMLYAVMLLLLIYLTCEMVVFLFHIQPSRDATVVLPALV